ncbi:MAG: peptidoglycan bridge formation glycyltransferase FemA/FemB family protein, partial [Erysipelotrichaceae bacterium]
MEFVTLSEEVFESFSSASPYANLWQSIDMAEMKRKNDMTTHYVGLIHNGEPIAAALLCSRKVLGSYREFTAPRGFLIDYHNLELLTQFLQALKTYIKKHRGIYFSTDPYLAYQQHALDGSVVEGGWNNRPVFERFIKQGFTHGGFTAGIDLTKEPRWIYTIPLTGHTPETLLASFERKCKRSIQKTIKYQLHVETLDANSLDVFFDVMEHTATRRDFKNRDKQYYYQLLESFGNRGHLKYLSVSLDVAALLVQLEAELALEQNSYDVALQKQTPQHHNEKLTSKLEQIQARITSCHKKIAELEALSQQKG